MGTCRVKYSPRCGVVRRCGAGRRPEKEGGRVGLPGLGLAPLRHEPCPSIHEGSLGAGERTARRVTPTVRGRGYRRLRLGTGPWLWLLACCLSLSLSAGSCHHPPGWLLPPSYLYPPPLWAVALTPKQLSPQAQYLSLSLHLALNHLCCIRHPLSQSLSLSS